MDIEDIQAYDEACEREFLRIKAELDKNSECEFLKYLDRVGKLDDLIIECACDRVDNHADYDGDTPW